MRWLCNDVKWQIWFHFIWNPIILQLYLLHVVPSFPLLVVVMARPQNEIGLRAIFQICENHRRSERRLKRHLNDIWTTSKFVPGDHRPIWPVLLSFSYLNFESMSFALPALKIHSFDGNFKRLEWRYCTPFRTIFLANYPSHSLIWTYITLLYRRCLHFLYTTQNNHSLFYFSVSQKHPRFRLAILIYNLEMWRSYCNMKTAAWNYDDLWLGSAFSNGVFNTTQLGTNQISHGNYMEIPLNTFKIGGYSIGTVIRNHWPTSWCLLKKWKRGTYFI